MAIKELKPWNPDQVRTSDILAGIRDEASSDFQRRIPDPTKAGLKATMQELTRYQPAYNEVIGALINKVGRTIARNASWSNPLARFKLGLLEWGESIEEYQTGLIKAYAYDDKASFGEALNWGRHDPMVQASYHTRNRQSTYAITVDHPSMRRAFQTEEGLAQYLTTIMDIPTKSDNWDEFLLMTALFAEYEAAGGFFKVHVDSVASSLTDAEIESHAKRNLRTLREYAEILPFLSVHYNAAKMPVAAEPEKLILFCTPAFKAALDVNGLAALFNVEYGEIPYRTIVLPKERIGIDGVEAILTTEDIFVVADTYFDTASQPNPGGRYENWFLHHDGIYSMSRFVPAIAFTTGEGDEITIVDAPVTDISAIVVTDHTGAVVSTAAGTKIPRGEGYQVDVSAITTGFNTAVILTLTGNENPRTTLDQDGKLWIEVDEKNPTLTITATAEDDSTKTKSRTLTLAPPKVSLWPNPGVIPEA